MLRFSITKAIQTHCVNPWLSLVHPSQAGHELLFLKFTVTQSYFIYHSEIQQGGRDLTEYGKE